MASNYHPYFYPSPNDPPNWRVGTKIHQAVGETLEYLLDTAELATIILVLIIIILCISKNEARLVPIVGAVAVCFHDWTLVFTLVVEVCSILLAIGGIVDIVIWRFFLNDACRLVRRCGWYSVVAVCRALQPVFEALFWWYRLLVVVTRLREWVEFAELKINRLLELPEVYWKEWVSDSRFSAWAYTLIPYFGRKPPEAEKGDEDGEDDLTVTIHDVKADDPIKPKFICGMHCSGSIMMDYGTASASNRDLLLPESYPLPSTSVPDTPAAKKIREEDPFKTPAPLRAGDPGFLDAYPSPEGGSEWQRGVKSSAEKEREKWKSARKFVPEPVKEYKPSLGSEPGFLDAYPCPPVPMPKQLVEDVEDFYGNVRLNNDEVAIESDSSGGGTELYGDHSNQRATVNSHGNDTMEKDIDVVMEKSFESSDSLDSQETIEPNSEDRLTEAGRSAATGSGVELYLKMVKVRDILANNAGAEEGSAGAENKAPAERSQTDREIAGIWDGSQETISPVVEAQTIELVAKPAAVTQRIEASPETYASQLRTEAQSTIQATAARATRPVEDNPDDHRFGAGSKRMKY